MTAAVVPFDKLPWLNPAPGLRYKVLARRGQRIRLAEFSDGFVEREWCTQGHMGYVLEGDAFLDFNGKQVPIQAGDTVAINEGEEDKHKLIIVPRGKIVLVLFEKAE